MSVIGYWRYLTDLARRGNRSFVKI